MAAYVESEIGCDIRGCQNHSTATLVVNGLGQYGDHFSMHVFTLPRGWSFRRLKFWHIQESLLCPEHNK